ncbi:terminase small subunit [Priestia endophytica]|uniref:terminase small subunit n=1 Tax=Priestia endophytica TaxID=135735 RepID=UPI000DCA8EC9|nr:hypothetical protein A4U60_25375 [Priestia endophytica]
MTKLTPKQQAFADLYIETANATTSYKNSGYSVKSDKAAAVEGSKLLRNPKVRAYIEERMAQKSAQRVAKQDEILSFLTQVMRGELTEQVPMWSRRRNARTRRQESFSQRSCKSR